MKEKKLLQAWNTLRKRYNLDENQVKKFKKYLALLKEWNNKFNLTAILDDYEVIMRHFIDSLSLAEFTDCNQLSSIADVGSGGGFPGIPLKIVYPHLNLTLIEVNGKKVQFLNRVADELDLENVFVEQVDWRTFIRGALHKIDLFCARASLSIVELLRMFKPSSAYKNSKLVYWAAGDWQPEGGEGDFIVDSYDYLVDVRKRKLVLFGKTIG